MPIPIDVLRRVSVVYTHAHCPDGMATAMILKDAFRMLDMSPRIEFLAHGTPEHRAAGTLPGRATSLFCDIAPVDNARVFAGVNEVIVLDHHKGAEELVRSFGELGVFADEKLEPGVSGATLAFREVWSSVVNERVLGPEMAKDPGVEVYRNVKDFAEACGARDCWQTKHPLFQRGQWISKMLMSKPADYWLDSVTTNPGYEKGWRPHPAFLSNQEEAAGRALFEAHEEAVRQAVEQCVLSDVHGCGLAVFQEQASGFRLCSDLAEAMRTKLTHAGPGVVAGFCYAVDKPGGEPRLLYSLRGLNGFDVAAFAKANGGGGHTAAAGFAMARDAMGVNIDPYDFIAHRLEKFLAK